MLEEKKKKKNIKLAKDRVCQNKGAGGVDGVMYTVTEWIEKKLGLKVNASKTHICRPSKLKYLGFGFCKVKTKWEAIPHKDSILKFKRKLKALCKRNWSIDLDYRITKLNQVIRGWINYFIIGRMKRHLTNIDEHLRTMIRVIIWKQWKVPSKREWGLKKLGVNKNLARLTAYCGNRYQWVVTKTCVVRAISKEKLTKKGLVSCIDYYNSRRHNLGLN